MTEHEFKDGELAWSPISGFGTCELTELTLYPVLHGGDRYTRSGKIFHSHSHPTLLTVEQAAKLGHSPPKQKVKKRWEFWVNLYTDGDWYLAASRTTAN